MVGGSATFETFPMPWIAAQSQCRSVVKSGPATPIMQGDGTTLVPTTWIKTVEGCTEKATVYWFVDEKFTITTANIVFFGIAKAICNFITGVVADALGRKWVIVIGWILALPMPFMVLFANGWWSVALSNLFLGIQQALVWSATIFMMIDYVGREHSGTAVGINETAGYTSQAICKVIAAAILDPLNPRDSNYWVLLGIIICNIIIAIFILKESRGLAKKEEDVITHKDSKFVFNTKLVWPSGRSSNIAVAQTAFVYTSFINKSLMALCFAGLMINFLSGFALSLFVKWMNRGGDGALWEKLDVKTVGNVSLCYGIFKGVLQFVCGFAGDRLGRKWVIVTGLLTCVLALVLIAGVGTTLADPTDGFFAGASILGIGTAIMYSTALAGVCDHSDPTWRSSALGAYRFWRDMGYAIGALITAAIADDIGIPWSVGISAILTALSALCMALFYEEVLPTDDIYNERTALPATSAKELALIEDGKASTSSAPTGTDFVAHAQPQMPMPPQFPPHPFQHGGMVPPYAPSPNIPPYAPSMPPPATQFMNGGYAMPR